ncbi:asparaginase [Saccharopolyspora gloriosae]|uniref:L-asparaginase II n=1 Tax=Saccharopolyspora gloriosae TaxID=455344 RepID=A0A840NQY5_9PSEU|nr:L-asparaginase II [Saccharopolyspora gloriosae]
MNAPAPLVELVRGGLREGVHFGSAVLLNADGSVLRSVGDVTAPMFPRSTVKPAQALAMLRAGLELPDDADLALGAASHNGEPGHIERAAAILARHGLDEDALRCPPDQPMHEPTRERWLSDGTGKRRLAMNCSGKHAAMLATCAQLGWPVEDYLDPEHPLQLGARETISELAGEPIETATVDGCGAPLFAIPLIGLARLFRGMVTAGGAAGRVADAMRAHPWLVAGTDRDDTELMTAVPGVLSKIGAEGVLALALPDGRAAAVKISDGASRARGPVAVEVLRAFGVDITGGRVRDLAEQPLLGGDRQVGVLRVIPGALDA